MRPPKAAVEAMERRRVDATVAGDLIALATLLDDDLTFVHSSGVGWNDSGVPADV